MLLPSAPRSKLQLQLSNCLARTCLKWSDCKKRPHCHNLGAVLQYNVKPCVRDFGEIPTDHEFDNGEVTLVMDDCNPGTRCLCLPGFYKRLTITAKVKTFLYSAVRNNVSARCQCVLLVKRRKAHHTIDLKFLHGASDTQAIFTHIRTCSVMLGQEQQVELHTGEAKRLPPCLSALALQLHDPVSPQGLCPWIYWLVFCPKCFLPCFVYCCC